MTTKTLILGIGPGRCGTLSLTRLLNRQRDCSVSHEASPLLKWEGDDHALDRIRCLERISGTPFFGDVSFFNVNYVALLAHHYNTRIIYLHRPKEQVINSFMRKCAEWKIQPINHWAKNRVGLIDTDFDPCFPKYEGDTMRDQLAQYYDDYERAVAGLWPLVKLDGVNLLQVETNSIFKSTSELNTLFDFIGIPAPRDTREVRERNYA